MRRLIPAFAALLPILASALVTSPAPAQDRAGDFDGYLLALSWIPAYCAADGDARRDPRCDDGSSIGWAVHGLWPQNDDGSWPEFCLTSRHSPSRRETSEQADLFGTSGSAWHQWDKHGRCTGLSAANYYRLVQTAQAQVTLPEVFAGVTRELRVDPDVVEAAFIEANPGLTPAMMVTSCDGRDLVELRLCLTRSLEPVDCSPAITRRECRLDAATLLPLR